MAVPARYRWVAVGSLLVRNRLNAAENAPEFSPSDLVAALTDRLSTGSEFRFYNNAIKAMWCSAIRESDNFFELLLQIGDKDVSGYSFFHFQNREFRDIHKDEEEGGHYSSHVFIAKQPDESGRYNTLVEKVPGIYLGSVKDHFCWACNDPTFEKEAPGPDGKPRSYRAIFDVDGYKSRTIRDALNDGVLTDIEFVSVEEDFSFGHDEAPVVDEVVRQARWKVGKKISEQQAQGLFAKAKEYVAEFSDNPDKSKMLVRIKASNGQIKQTEVLLDSAELLEQAFIQNEVISGFDGLLPSRYDKFHEEVSEQMRNLGSEL